MKYEWIICTLDDAEDKLKEMRADGWHPISHSIWHDVRKCTTMASFIFRKKETAPSDNVLKFIKQRVDDLHH